PEHDEMLFIVVHQTYELWFKLLLHEFDKIRDDFRAGRLPEAIATFKRARTIMKVLVEQVDIVETLTPMSFSSFRDRLETASGFQSWQFRELEFLYGYKRAQVTGAIPDADGSGERALAERRFREPTLVDRFYRFLAQRGLLVPRVLLERDVTRATEPNADLQEELYRAYRLQPDLVLLFELM